MEANVIGPIDIRSWRALSGLKKTIAFAKRQQFKSDDPATQRRFQNGMRNEQKLFDDILSEFKPANDNVSQTQEDVAAA